MVKEKDVFIVDDVVTSGTSVDALRCSLKKVNVTVCAVLSLGQSDRRIVSERDLARFGSKISADFPEDKYLQNDIRLVFDGCLKHKLNTIEREITGDQNWKVSSRRLCYEYIKNEAGRIRSEIEIAQGIQPGQGTEAEFRYGRIERGSPLSSLAVREQNDIRQEWGKRVNIENESRLPKEKIDKILDRRSEYSERLSMPDVPPDLREMMDEYFQKTQDKVTGLQSRWALDETLDDLRKGNIPHAVAAVDFRNLGGLNTELGHEKTNEILQEVSKTYMQRAVHEWGGELYRSGGDEFHVIVPYMSAKELTDKMKSLQEDIQKNVVVKRELEFMPHKTQNGMPTGAGNIDFGCVDSSGCKSRSDMLKVADKICYANKREYLESVKINEIDYGRLWEFNDKDKKYHLAIDLSKEKEYESRFNRSETIGRGSDGFQSPGTSGGRHENRGPAIDRIGDPSDRDKRGVRDKEGRVLTEERGIAEEKNTRAIVEELVEYAGTKHISVPEKTQERWIKLLESGESDANIKHYIDTYSKEIKGPEVAREKTALVKENKEIGMDI